MVTRIPIKDNSFNSLDWPGTYKRIVPCVDCEGIETIIFLDKDLFYSGTTKYLAKKRPTLNEKKGEFTWNKEGNIISVKKRAIN